MGANAIKLPIISTSSPENESRTILMDSASNELVFAVVGHAGSGTSFIAQQLENLLKGIGIKDDKFDVVTLKAREVISEWACLP